MLLVGFLVGGIGISQGLLKDNTNIKKSLTYTHA